MRGHHQFFQELRREVRAVLPDNRAKLRVDSKTPELFRIAQGPEHGAVQMVREVRDASGAVVKAQPYLVSAAIIRLGHVQDSEFYSNGSMSVSGSPR